MYFAIENVGRGHEEARYNLATRIMSNGVEVIVAGDKTTLPGEPDIRRVAPTNVHKPVTLKPSTLTDHMVMMLPQESANVSYSYKIFPKYYKKKPKITDQWPGILTVPKSVRNKDLLNNIYLLNDLPRRQHNYCI